MCRRLASGIVTDTNPNVFLRDKNVPSYVPTALGLMQFLIDTGKKGPSADPAEQQQRLHEWLQLLTTSYFELLTI